MGRPILGITKLHRIEENIAAADIELTTDEVARLSGLSDSIKIVDGCYPDFLKLKPTFD